MNSKPCILVIGSINMDFVLHTHHLPSLGATVMGEKYFTNLGGKGLNQAIAAARMGGDVSLISHIGTDAYGKQSLLVMHQDGIDASHVSTDKDTSTGLAFVFINEHAQNAILVMPGANHTLSTEHIDQAEHKFYDAEVILLQQEIPLDTIVYAIKKGVKWKKKIILNPSPILGFPEAMYAHIHTLILNEAETHKLTDLIVSDKNSLVKAASILRKKGVQYVVITMGEKGVFVNSESLTHLFPSKKVEAVDTTAAGDAFTGAFAVGIAKNMSIGDAISFAISTASITVTRPGAQQSIPYLHELNLGK